MEESFFKVIKTTRTSLGINPYQASFQSPVVLIFLRHFGCTFCRETVHSISLTEEKIKSLGIIPVFIHMSDPENANEFFAKYFNYPIHHISDPGKKLYQAFGIRTGNFLELFGPSTWIKGIWYGLFKGQGAPFVADGDIGQLSAVIVLKEGQISLSHHTKNASEIIGLENII